MPVIFTFCPKPLNYIFYSIWLVWQYACTFVCVGSFPLSRSNINFYWRQLQKKRSFQTVWTNFLLHNMIWCMYYVTVCFSYSWPQISIKTTKHYIHPAIVLYFKHLAIRVWTTGFIPHVILIVFNSTHLLSCSAYFITGNIQGSKLIRAIEA